MANKVREIRISLGWSQAELARKANTSQQQIQRIEGGKQTAKLDLATAICAALGKPINKVFPGASKALAALAEGPLARHFSQEGLEVLRETGIDADYRQYTLKVLLRGHETPMFFPIGSADSARLFRAVQEESDDLSQLSFIVFDSDDYRVAINLRSITFIHFLWDSGMGQMTPELQPRSPIEVLAYLAEKQTPIVLDGEPEYPDDDGGGYLNHIFYMLEMDTRPSDRLHIVDGDGESAFIRAGDLTLIKASLWLLDPEERLEEDNSDDGEKEPE
jgi:DNA-binding XRE family transcriptional regulator